MPGSAHTGSSLAELKNIGPVTAQRLEAAGAVEAFRRVEALFPAETSLNLLYSLEGAIWVIHWAQLPPEVTERLRQEAGRGQ